MVDAIVFGFAVAERLVPVAGAAPFDVLARQLPRLLVLRLNGGGDRGVRFLPFLGTVGGKREFLVLQEPLEPERLVELQQQEPARLLVDGCLQQDRLAWRLLDGGSGRILKEGESALDPRQPFDVLLRLEFEIIDLLGWPGRPQPALPLQGEALGWFLVLKDAVLRREANLAVAEPEPLRPLRESLRLAPAVVEVQATAVDFASQLLRRGEDCAELAGALRPLLADLRLDATGMLRLAAVLESLADHEAAATVAVAAARLAPLRAELVERAAAALFRVGRYAEVRTVVAAARAAGQVSPAALAQLAAACDRLGDLPQRLQLTEELLAAPELPIPVARLLVSFLLEDERVAAARGVAERALAKDAAQPLLQFELARACLQLGDEAAALPALQAALQAGLPPALVGPARRFLRLLAWPGLWQGVNAIERALAAGDAGAARIAASRSLRRVRAAAEASYQVALVRHRLGELAAAERALRRALRRDPQHGDAHNRLGVLLLERGLLVDGHRHLAQAHRLAPEEAAPLLHLAQACALLGRIDEADCHLAAAERLGADPGLLQAVRREVGNNRD